MALTSGAAFQSVRHMNKILKFLREQKRVTTFRDPSRPKVLDRKTGKEKPRYIFREFDARKEWPVTKYNMHAPEAIVGGAAAAPSE